MLREVLVGLLADDPTLEPRDIPVMCPDIETYAPLISAGFGLADIAEGQGHPAHQLRVRLADRSLGATNPLLGVAAQLVELVRGRLTATRVLDLAGSDPVRARFGFGDDALERMAQWVGEAGIRWGYDADHRAEFGLGGLSANTWAAGIRRVLLGAAMSGLDHRRVAGALPIDDVSDGDPELAGRFAEFISRLHTFLSGAEAARTVAEWTRVLGDGVHQLTATALDDSWQIAQFDRELARIAAGAAGKETLLRQSDVRALLQQRLRGRPTRSNFRTGTLTVCTMVPMRSVPHRVVCPVGLDDGVFPRATGVDGDDVLARNPRTGEAGRAVRGPPAAARRHRRDHRDAGDHLHRTRRAQRRGATARRAARRASRRPRPHGRRTGARSRADPAPAAALRRGQPGAGTPAGGSPLHLRPVGAGRCTGRARRAGGRARAGADGAGGCRPTGHRGVAGRPAGLLQAPGARFPAAEVADHRALRRR
ncbi:hypothetical protein [Nocardioides sp. B-3]|uniref:hypothetical protein n=1 Tax=Nocardioides sp. B-3 TaxID=2895565 RepID=UPI00300E44C4